jgi:hypothetical protein
MRTSRAIPKSTLIGVSGTVLAIMMVLGFVLDMMIILTTSGPPLLSTDNIGTELLRAKGSSIWLLEGWIYTLMIVPGFIFVLAVYWSLLGDDHALAGIGLFASALFWIFHTLHNVAMLTVLQVFVPAYAGGTSEGTSIEVMAVGLLGFANLLFGFGGSVGGFFLVCSLVAFGLVTLKSRLPRWIGYVAVAGGLAVLLSYLQAISGAFVLVGLLGWILNIVWVASTTIALLRRPGQARLVAEMGAA